MKSFKKLAALALAAVMGVAVFAVSASAAFDTSAEIITRWDETGTYLVATVATEKACGAVKATLTYEGATLVADKTQIIEKDVADVADTFKTAEGSVTFAVATDDVKKGDTIWAEFWFTVNENATAVKFAVTDSQACDISETLDADGINITADPVTISTVVTKGLGAQFRDSDTNAEDAIRFGGRIDRDKSTGKTMITVDGKEYPAYFCGFLWAWSDLVTADALTADVDAATGAVTSTDKYINVVNTTACKANTDEYLLYTLVLKGFYAADGVTELKDGNTSLMDIPFKAAQYVVYKDTDANEFKVLFSNTMKKSYREVKDDATAISANIYK